MNQEEFKKYIKSIGFDEDILYYYYKQYSIYFLSNHYNFHNGFGWEAYDLNDLRPIQEHFKKELRSIKLKQILK